MSNLYENRHNYIVSGRKSIQIMFTALGFALIIAHLLQLLLSSYFGYYSSEAVSTVVADEWCEIKEQGLGNHCFSDFYSVLDRSLSSSPWSGRPNPYPPFALTLFKPFAYLMRLQPNSHLSLILYFIMLFIALILPTIIAYKSERVKKFTAISIFFILIASAPVIVALDRGNVIILLIPLMYLFTINYLEANYRKVLIYGITMVLIKPQLILLGCIFIGLKNWNNFVKWIFFSILALLCSFILYPNSILTNIKDYLAQLIKYQGYTNAGSLSPPNLSIANSYSIFERIIITIFPGISHKNPLDHWDFYPTFITIIIFSLSVIFLTLSKNKLLNFLIVILNPILLPNVSFSYYLCLMIPITIIIFLHSLSADYNYRFIKFISIDEEIDFYKTLNVRIVRIIFFSIALTLFIPWAIPWRIFPNFQQFWWSNIGINWLFGQVLLNLSFICIIINGIWIALQKNLRKNNLDKFQS